MNCEYTAKNTIKCSERKEAMKRKQTVITLEQAFTEFITDKSLKGLSQSTLDNYRISYNVFLSTLELDPSTPVTTITQSTVQQFIASRMDTKPTSLNHYLRDIRTFLNYLNLKIDIKLIRIKEEKVEGYSEPEIRQLLVAPLTSANYSIWKGWLITCIILGTGARIGSVVSLKKENIDHVSRTITFPHSKNGKVLCLPLTIGLEKCLRAFEQAWDNNSQWVVPDFSGAQSTPHGCLQAHNRFCKARQVEPKGLHALRHTFARMAVKNGMDLYTLNKFLGHSDIRMTEHYVNLFGQNLPVSAVPLDLMSERQVSRHQREG